LIWIFKIIKVSDFAHLLGTGINASDKTKLLTICIRWNPQICSECL